MQVNNFNEFMDTRGLGGTTPGEWGHLLYRHTFGPWVSFAELDSPASTGHHEATLTPNEVSGLLELQGEASDYIKGFLSLNHQGVSNWGADEFEAYLNSYINGTHVRVADLSWTREGDVLNVVIDRPSEARYDWTSYDSQETRAEDFAAKVVGIKVGSIVEGSDVELEPRILMFPFESDFFQESLNDLEAEVSFYWDRDNSQWYIVTSPEGKIWYPQLDGSGNWQNQEDIPQEVLDELANREDIQYDETIPFDIFPGWTHKLYYNDGIF
jgi:hypothetical protein